MEPYSALTSFDLDVIDNYICRATTRKPKSTKDVLMTWSRTKPRLFDEVFHGKLRMTEHLHTSFSVEDKKHRTESVARASVGLVSAFSECAYRAKYDERTDEASVRTALSLFAPQEVADGKYVSDTEIYFDGEWHIFRGKRMRVIRKVLELFEFKNMKAFHQYRDQVSLIHTVQHVDADVVLSIHPIDYLSMSDNSCGWLSCMSLVERPGSCRSGAIDYLNSPTAIVAYVASKQEYLPGVPNKTWRQMIFCDPVSGTILGGRQYPYKCRDFAVAAMTGVYYGLNGFRPGNNPSIVQQFPLTRCEKRILERCDNYDVKNYTNLFLQELQEAGTDFSAIPYSLGACNDFFMFNDDTFYKITGTQAPAGHRLPMSGAPTCLLCGSLLEPIKVGTNRVICDQCVRGENE